jgi:hypothetical protein
VTGDSGYVASEGFPNLYPPNKECLWTIKVRKPLWSVSFISNPGKGLTTTGCPLLHQAPPPQPSPLPFGSHNKCSEP